MARMACKSTSKQRFHTLPDPSESVVHLDDVLRSELNPLSQHHAGRQQEPRLSPVTIPSDPTRPRASISHTSGDENSRLGVPLFTEACLPSSVPDTALALARHVAPRHDRTRDSGKSRGDGSRVYASNRRCSGGHRSPPPIKQAWEPTVFMLTAVYIPPHANASSTLGHLHDIFSSQQSSNPKAVCALTGDFNRADKESAARTRSACQMCYHWGEFSSNIKMCFRARPLPHVGPLIPALSLLGFGALTTSRTVGVWPGVIKGAAE